MSVGATWKDHFFRLELHHGLDINNTFHIWLLHTLFLPTINAQLAFFAQSWNLHKLQIRDGPNRSPADLFGFDMLVHGIRGTRLPLPTTNTADENLTAEELEVYGVDWEALRDDRLLQSQEEGNADEGFTSWVGRQGPPQNLNEVRLDPPRARCLSNRHPTCSIPSAILWASPTMQMSFSFGQTLSP